MSSILIHRCGGQLARLFMQGQLEQTRPFIPCISHIPPTGQPRFFMARQTCKGEQPSFTREKVNIHITFSSLCLHEECNNIPLIKERQAGAQTQNGRCLQSYRAKDADSGSPSVAAVAWITLPWIEHKRCGNDAGLVRWRVPRPFRSEGQGGPPWEDAIWDRSASSCTPLY